MLLTVPDKKWCVNTCPYSLVPVLMQHGVPVRHLAAARVAGHEPLDHEAVPLLGDNKLLCLGPPAKPAAGGGGGKAPHRRRPVGHSGEAGERARPGRVWRSAERGGAAAGAGLACRTPVCGDGCVAGSKGWAASPQQRHETHRHRVGVGRAEAGVAWGTCSPLARPPRPCRASCIWRGWRRRGPGRRSCSRRQS